VRKPIALGNPRRGLVRFALGALGVRRAKPDRAVSGFLHRTIERIGSAVHRRGQVGETAMHRRGFVLIALSATLCGVAGLPVARAQQPSITVFAAASMKNALDDANAAFTRASGIKVVASYAATSALVRQIEQGAPTDVFVSADMQWMDYAVEKKLVQATTHINLLGNKLVLIAPVNSAITPVTIARGLELAKLLGDGRLVTADMTAVPVGRYAKAALENLGLWEQVSAKIAMVENVRVALALVARGETPLGIVYATDAKAEQQVTVVGTFPDGSHPPIVYPVAATATAKPHVGRYLAFIRSATAKAILEGNGFSFLPPML
jgi:molybdate transport system substrate-binding protein